LIAVEVEGCTLTEGNSIDSGHDRNDLDFTERFWEFVQGFVIIF